MSALTIINDILLDIPEIVAIVETRVFPVEAEQAVAGPYIVTNVISGSDTSLIDAPGMYPRHRVSIDCCAQKATVTTRMGDILFKKLPYVIKRTVGDFKDVDIMFADVDFTQRNSENTARMRTLQFFIRWRDDGESP